MEPSIRSKRSKEDCYDLRNAKESLVRQVAVAMHVPDAQSDRQ